MRNSKIDEKIFKELKEGFDYLEEYDKNKVLDIPPSSLPVETTKPNNNEDQKNS